MDKVAPVVIKLQNSDFGLASRLYCPLLLHTLMKQAAMLGRPMWQETEGGLWPTASKKQRPLVQQVARNSILPTTT